MLRDKPGTAHIHPAPTAFRAVAVKALFYSRAGNPLHQGPLGAPPHYLPCTSLTLTNPQSVCLHTAPIREQGWYSPLTRILQMRKLRSVVIRALAPLCDPCQDLHLIPLHHTLLLQRPQADWGCRCPPASPPLDLCRLPLVPGGTGCFLWVEGGEGNRMVGRRQGRCTVRMWQHPGQARAGNAHRKHGVNNVFIGETEAQE